MTTPENVCEHCSKEKVAHCYLKGIYYCDHWKSNQQFKPQRKEGAPKVLVVGCGPVDTNEAREALSRLATPSPEVTEQMVEAETHRLTSLCEDFQFKLSVIKTIAKDNLTQIVKLQAQITTDAETIKGLMNERDELLAANGVLVDSIRQIKKISVCIETIWICETALTDAKKEKPS